MEEPEELWKIPALFRGWFGGPGVAVSLLEVVARWRWLLGDTDNFLHPPR